MSPAIYSTPACASGSLPPDTLLAFGALLPAGAPLTAGALLTAGDVRVTRRMLLVVVAGPADAASVAASVGESGFVEGDG